LQGSIWPVPEDQLVWFSGTSVRGHSQRISKPRGGGGFGKSGQTRT
jgi:hypothetical protein